MGPLTIPEFITINKIIINKNEGKNNKIKLNDKYFRHFHVRVGKKIMY